MTGLLAWLVQYVLQLVSRVFHGVLDVFFHVTVGGLGFAGHLVHNTFLAKGFVARDLASNFLDLALDLLPVSFDTVPRASRSDMTNRRIRFFELRDPWA